MANHLQDILELYYPFFLSIVPSATTDTIEKSRPAAGKHGEVGLRGRERNDEGGDDEGNGRPRAAEILAPERRPVPVPPRPAVSLHVLVQPGEDVLLVVHAAARLPRGG